MSAYYNEIDPHAAEWLRNLIREGLIAPGDVDERSIEDVCADDLAGYTQCHFFAGIGGWSYALRLAGWPDDRPVWTGSCPCQPFSSASRGAGKGTDDDRHLWPVWFRLISACAPDWVFGEQVARALPWLDEVWDDMEGAGYAFAPIILPAVIVEKNHVRERIYFAGHADGNGKPVRAINAKASGLQGHQGQPGNLLRADGLPARVAGMRSKTKVMAGFGNAIVPQVAAEFVRACM